MVSKRRIRHDLSFLTSVGLLITTALAALSGWVSDLWDLNDFFYHRYAGYLMTALALAHILLFWRQFVGYARWRMGRRRRPRNADQSDTRADRAPGFGELLRAPLSRRGFVGLCFGGVAGFVLGRGLSSRPDLPYGSDVGEVYHEWSKPKLLSLLGTVANWGQQPDLYKEHADVERISLPRPGDAGGLLTEDAIKRRRSIRDYSRESMTLDEVSRVLFFTGGITAERWGHKLRAAPSAGALYPIEIYPIVHRVTGLRAGLYHYGVRDHTLSILKSGNLSGQIVRHGLMQEFLGQANLVFVFTAIFQRLRWKYQERTYRYALLEAGHLGQNLYLVATSMGMGACAVGAFLDDGLNGLLGVDGQREAAIYMLAVGKV
jgi:SagB-type dehydrogenase family enzyme